MAESPSRDDLQAVADFFERFSAPEFVAGEWIEPTTRDDGVIELGWWSASAAVAEWEQALYDHKIIDPESDYLDESNVEFVNQAVAKPSLLNKVDLPTLRRALTFLARAERHTGGGWYASAFESGMALTAMKRLGELAST